VPEKVAMRVTFGYLDTLVSHIFVLQIFRHSTVLTFYWDLRYTTQITKITVIDILIVSLCIHTHIQQERQTAV